MAVRGRQSPQGVFFERKGLREAEFFGYLMKFGGSFQVFVVVPLNRVIWEVYWSEKGAPLLFEKIGFL